MPKDVPFLPDEEQQRQIIDERIKEYIVSQTETEALLAITPNEVMKPYGYLKEQARNWQDLEYDPFLERAIVDDRPAGADAIESSDVFSSLVGKGAISSEQIGAMGEGNILDVLTKLVKESSTLSAATTLDAAGGASDQAVITITTKDYSDPNRVILAVLHITAFEGSVGGANVIPYGSGTDPDHYQWYTTHDWNSNDNYYHSAVHYLRNMEAAQNSVLWRGHIRYLGKTTS